MNELFIPILLGTARQDRLSEKAARFTHKLFSKRSDVETELLDVRDYLTDRSWAPWQENDMSKKWKEIMARADGLIIVTPEYNHGYPGELKILIDKADTEYAHKPVAFCGVSGGGLGGARVVQQLTEIVRNLSMVSIVPSVYFPHIKTLFNGAGEITDPAYERRLDELFEELLWWATALKNAR